MSLTVKQINADACILLTFAPDADAIDQDSSAPYRILLDPWISGASTVIHPRVSTATFRQPPCVQHVQELPEIDLIIVSQSKSDHCHEETLRQLTPSAKKPIIVAEPASASLIKGWKYFDADKVQILSPYEAARRVSGRDSVLRVPVPAAKSSGGEAGEVTITFIPERRDFSGLHAAVGITYQPPTAATTRLHPPRAPPSTGLLSPPISPTSVDDGDRDTLLVSPVSDCSRPLLSVIFSPHGITYPSLAPYIETHLRPAGALPLTALLHCFNSVANPWWLGGNMLLGAPAGLETAARLGARAWISAHDGDKKVRGWGTKLLRTERWGCEQLREALRSEPAQGKGKEIHTEVLALAGGEEVVLTAEGVKWQTEK